MAWTKSPPELIKDFDEAIPNDPKIERRKMFGYPALFVGGNMAGGLWQDKVVVRVGVSDVRWMVGEGGTPFEPTKGRPMQGFVVVPDRVRQDGARLKKWISAGVAHASTLPPKAARKKATAKKKPAARK